MASAIVETTATRSPAIVAGKARGARRAKRLPPREPHPTRRLEHVGRDAAQPFEDVPEQDQQRVADERHLDGRDGEAGDGDEELEEREAGDRVDDRRERDERLLEESEPVRDERGAERRTKPTATATSVSSTCSTSAGWSVPDQLSRTQSGQKRRFSTTQLLPLPKSGITGPL